MHVDHSFEKFASGFLSDVARGFSHIGGAAADAAAPAAKAVGEAGSGALDAIKNVTGHGAPSAPAADDPLAELKAKLTSKDVLLPILALAGSSGVAGGLLSAHAPGHRGETPAQRRMRILRNAAGAAAIGGGAGAAGVAGHHLLTRDRPSDQAGMASQIHDTTKTVSTNPLTRGILALTGAVGGGRWGKKVQGRDNARLLTEIGQIDRNTTAGGPDAFLKRLSKETPENAIVRLQGAAGRGGKTLSPELAKIVQELAHNSSGQANLPLDSKEVIRASERLQRMGVPMANMTAKQKLLSYLRSPTGWRRLAGAAALPLAWEGGNALASGGKAIFDNVTTPSAP